MKKGSTVATLVLIVGVIILGISFVIAGFNFKNYSSSKSRRGGEFNTYTYECKGDINELVVDETSDAVRVLVGDVDKAVVTYHAKEEDAYTITEENGKLTVAKNKKPQITIGFYLEFEDQSTEILLPKNFYGDVDVEVSSGAANVNGLKVKDLSVKSSSGASKVENVEATGNVELKCTSGLAGMENVKAAGDVLLKTSSGLASAENVTCKSFTGASTSGLFKCKNVVSDSFIDVKGTSGSVKVEEIEAKEGISLESTSGLISGTIADKEENFSIITKQGSGSCNLKDSRDGEKTLDVSIGSGSINIKFTK